MDTPEGFGKPEQIHEGAALLTSGRAVHPQPAGTLLGQQVAALFYIIFQFAPTLFIPRLFQTLRLTPEQARAAGGNTSLTRVVLGSNLFGKYLQFSRENRWLTVVGARLAAGLCFPVLPGHHMSGVKGQAFQPESCADSLQLGRGLPVYMSYEVTLSSSYIPSYDP